MRITRRLFPDANQLGLASGTILSQSRVTFSGQRGRCVIYWTTNVTNAGAGAKTQVRLNTQGSAPTIPLGNKGDWTDAAANIFGVMIAVLVVDPPAGSFVEVSVAFTGAGQIDLPALQGNLIIISMPHDADDGPTATVA